MSGEDLLNKPFTEEEVIIALNGMANNKSTADGLRAELFKYAKVKDDQTGKWSNMVVGFLVQIFNAIFLNGCGLPESWSKAFLVPISKGKGDPLSWDSHRGISILSTWYKLFCKMLCLRLEKHCEKGKFRAISQCGFRKFLSTTTAAFTLLHCIIATCSKIEVGGRGGALFVCFVDFSKAFDSVSRALLWRRLEKIGVSGAMLQMLKEIYNSKLSYCNERST